MSVYSDLLAAISTRINGHIGTDKVLDGYSFEGDAVKETEDYSALPCVRLFPPTISENDFARNEGRATMRARFTVATRRAEGITGHLTVIETVLDALDLDPTTGNVRANLGGNATKATTETTIGGEWNLTDKAITSVIEMTFHAMPFIRGSRRG